MNITKGKKLYVSTRLPVFHSISERADRYIAEIEEYEREEEKQELERYDSDRKICKEPVKRRTKDCIN